MYIESVVRFFYDGNKQLWITAVARTQRRQCVAILSNQNIIYGTAKLQ